MKCTRTDNDNDNESRLDLEGALDALTTPEIRPIFDKILADGRKKVTVDIAKVTMIDSSGVGAVVSLFKRVKAGGGEVKVVGAKDQPLAVLKLLKLDRVFGL